MPSGNDHYNRPGLREHLPLDPLGLLRRPPLPRPLAERLQEADALGRLERRLAICAPLPAKEVEDEL